MVMGNGTCKINHGKQCENECLDKGDKEAEEHKDDRYQERNEGEEYGGNKVVTGYVAEEPYAQGHGSRNVADELDGAHQMLEDNVGVPRHHVTEKTKLPQVLDPVLRSPSIVCETKHRSEQAKVRVHISPSRKEAGERPKRLLKRMKRARVA